MQEKSRCYWCTNDPLYMAYHDQEWGVPCHDDRLLFEMLILEGMQAGLSWLTVLKKRAAFREAFSQFDPQKVALYQDEKILTLLSNPALIRNRLKLTAAVHNARKYLVIQTEYGSFANYIWQFVNATPIQNTWETAAAVPSQTPISAKMSTALKKRGFKFVGSTICYAFMQAVGMVNDHTLDCFRRKELR